MIDTSCRGSSRVARSERNWRTLSESSKQHQQQQQETLNKQTDKTNRRKKSTLNSNELVAVVNEKKEEEDKKSVIEEDEQDNKNGKKIGIKRARKWGRKKIKTVTTADDDSNVNGNEPEEKYMPNDSDFESDNEYNLPTPIISKDVIINVGDRIRVKYGKGKQLKVYEAKVMNINDCMMTDNDFDFKKIRYFVHYTGWNTRYDEWIKRKRIVERIGDVCDKSPKRRGNKSKNKGVPLTNEVQQQLSAPIKTEPLIKVETQQQVPSPAVSSGKRGRPPSASSFRNQEKNSNNNDTLVNKINKNETSNTNKKLTNTISPTKRCRQRSGCIEIDEEETIEQQTNEDSVSTNIECKTGSKKANQKEEKMQTDKPDVEDENHSTEIKEQPENKRGYKKLKRSNSLKGTSKKEEKQLENLACNEMVNNNKLKQITTTTPITTVQQVQDDEDLGDRRRQRKKKNDKTSVPDEQPITVKEEDKQNLTITTGKKRKPQQQNLCLSDEDNSSNSSSSNIAPSNNLNKFSKRKRILNSKYRQDNVLTGTSKNESTSNTTNKETEVAKKRLKEDIIIEPEKTVEEETTAKPIKNSKQQSEIQQNEVESEKIVATASSANEVNNSLLMCKEEIPASPGHEEEINQQQSESENNNHDKSEIELIKNLPDKTVPKQKQVSEINTTANVIQSSIKTTGSAESCSTISITDSNLISKEIKTDDQDNLPSSSSNSLNNNDLDNNAKDSNKDESVCIPQPFTPPTTPESVKSTSTNCSQNHKEFNDEKATNETISSTNQPQESISQNKIETHGLDMIAIASAVIDNQENDKKENNNSVDSSINIINNAFSPRKKRRGRGRTPSQSESNSTVKDNLSSNVFNTSFNNKDNQVIKDQSSAQKVKGCKTRGSLGRKVKQTNQNNIDCQSESTSHSDNFESTSPSSMSLNCLNSIDYNPISKYNFLTPIDENLETDKRIQILQDRLQDLRKTYLNIKSELATIERRRKKSKKRKERSLSPQSQIENKTNSPQSSTSSNASTKDHHSLKRSNSFTENHFEDKNTAVSECNLNSNDKVKEIF